MCPVTLFLSMAIADKVIDGVSTSSDIFSLCNYEWSGWLLLPYKQELSHLPVLRRTGNKSRVISSCVMKPSAVYKMMQAQLDRAGHGDTFAAILRDTRNATQRIKRRVDSGVSLILIGRGQGEFASTLLASELVPASHMLWEVRTFPTSANCLKSPYPLPHVLDIQLKYDITRSIIISYLYGAYAPYSTILDILWPFVGAAAPKAHEPFYPDASPNASGSCPWCEVQLKRIPMKSHLLKCSQKSKNYEMEKRLTAGLQQKYWSCKWGSCTSGQIDHAEAVATHMSDHLPTGCISCQWDSCKFQADCVAEIHAHLATSHDVHTQMTIPTRARFCVECGLWLLSDLDWGKHCTKHTNNPDIIYGPIISEGILAAPRRCPYCMAQGRFVQMENAGHYAEHIEDHINKQVDNSNGQGVQCPHHSCPKRDFSKKELWDHFDTVHGIILS
ncbi:hypothetical protein Ptr902_12020 [Pyrenophora tritici-repentis]|nr:hypothetical protein Ptr902_12020 [Pyrenophora tritici-repentis]